MKLSLRTLKGEFIYI